MAKHLSLLLVLCAGLAAGAPGARAQSAGAFARLGFGARGMAMGNALVADASGAASPYYNPALAPFAEGQSLTASVALLSLDRELQTLQVAAPLRPRAGIAAGLVHAGVSGIDGRDGSGYHTRDYAVDEFAFFLAFGTRLGGRATAGVGLQLFRADYAEALSPVNSIGVDVGLTLRLTDALHLGFAVDDLLARYSWDTSGLYGEDGRTTSDRFPARLRLGGAYALPGGRGRLLFEYESHVRQADRATRAVQVVGGVPQEVTASERLQLHQGRVRVGGEVRLADAFTVRAGVDRLGDGGVGGATPTAGFMVEQPLGTLVTRVAYAFMLEPYAVGAMHFVTLRVLL